MFAIQYKNVGVGFIAPLLWLFASHTAVAETPAPVKIAVFPFELEDFGAASKGGEQPHLAESTEEARKQLAASSRYTPIDTASADMSTAKGQPLRDCGGCEAGIASKLGADQAMIGVISRISNTEYLIKLRVSDAHTGAVISNYESELRMGADYSWSRGVRSLMQNRVLTEPAPAPANTAAAQAEKASGH
ncbi:MAG: DUF3280 domain-containing protein [Gammaproteobacteria bacterium]